MELSEQSEVAPAPSAKTSRPFEIGVAIGSLALGSLVLFLASRIHVRAQLEGGIGPRWWPEQVATGIVILSLALLVFAIWRPPLDRSDMLATTRAGWVRVIVTIALTAAYFWAWPVFGFIVVTIVYLLALLVVFGARSWKALLAYPLGVTAFLYLLFHYLLRVPL